MTPKLDIERLTAYVLDELNEPDRQALDKALVDDPAAQAVVAELRGTAQLSRETRDFEPTAALSEEQRAAIVAQAKDAGSKKAKRVLPMLWTWPVRIAAAVLVIGIAASLYLPTLVRDRGTSAVQYRVAAKPENAVGRLDASPEHGDVYQQP